MSKSFWRFHSPQYIDSHFTIVVTCRRRGGITHAAPHILSSKISWMLIVC